MYNRHVRISAKSAEFVKVPIAVGILPADRAQKNESEFGIKLVSEFSLRNSGCALIWEHGVVEVFVAICQLRSAQQEVIVDVVE